MSITDELRHSIEEAEQVYGCECKHLLALADRIDMEHERAMADAYLSGTPTDEKLTELGWIRLPKDVDGEYIHMGDKMECFTSQHRDVPKVFEVQRIIMDDITGWRLVAYPATYVPEECRHYHAPTVEDVLLEACKAYHGLMIEGISDFAHDMPAPSEIIAKYAAKLRLAEKRETYE